MEELREAMEARGAIQPGEIINPAITLSMKYELIRDKRLWNSQTGFQTLCDGQFIELLGVCFLVTTMVLIFNVGTEEALVWQFACPAWEVLGGVVGDVGRWAARLTRKGSPPP